MGRRAVLRRISILLAIALLGFGAVAGGAALADETIPRDTGGDPGRVPGDPPGNELPTNSERGPGDGPVDPGGGLGGGSGPVTPPMITAPPSDPPTGGGGGGGIGGGGTGTAVPGVDLALTKSDSPDPVNAGANLTYTITITNDGDTAATNAVMTDQLPQVAPGPVTTTQGSCSGQAFITCNLGTIASGATVTITINVQVPPSTAPGTLSNTAEVHSDGSEGDTSNNAATETTTVTASADLAVTKDAVQSPVPTGTNLTYTINLIPPAPSDAQNVTLTDVVPAGTTFVSFAPAPGWSATVPSVGGTGTITATKSTFTSSDSSGFTLVVHVNAPSGTTLVNTATVSSSTPDPNPGNNSATESTPVSQAADVLAMKTDAPDPVVAGNNLTYTITVTNNGPDNAANAILSDTLPAATTFFSLSSPGGWSCTTPAVGATGAVSCSNPSVAPAASGVFTLVVKVNSSAAGGSTISNTASVSSSTFDPNTGNNSATAATTVNGSADLSVTKSASPTPVTAGTNVTYALGVSNAGPSDAQSVSFTDAVPAGTTFVSFVQNTGPAFTLTTPAVGGTGTVTASNASFAAGASATFTMVVKVNANAAADSVINNSAHASSTTADPNPINNTDAAAASVATSADLAVTKTVSPDPVTAGNNLTYTINVTNSGPSDAQSVAVVDAVPAGTSFGSATPSQGSCTGTTTVTCNLGTLAPNGTATISLVVNVSPSTPPGLITNTASATTTTTDPDPGNNTDTEVSEVNTSADLSVTKADSPDPVIAGTDLTYTVTATNNGPSNTGGDVTVTDTLPAGTSFVSATPSVGSCVEGPPVSCDVGPMAPNATVTVTVVVHVDSSVPEGSELGNNASVSSGTSDPNTENNSVVEETRVETSADVALTKEAAPDPVTAGNELTYTITATNDGPSDAQDVTVTDPLPAGTTFVSATPSQGSCTGTTTVTCGLGTLTDGASATITLVVHVDPGTPGGTVITNTATVTSPQPEVTAATADPADANNSASVSVTVLARPEAPQSVPATGSAGTATAAFAVVAVPTFTG